MFAAFLLTCANFFFPNCPKSVNDVLYFSYIAPLTIFGSICSTC